MATSSHSRLCPDGNARHVTGGPSHQANTSGRTGLFWSLLSVLALTLGLLFVVVELAHAGGPRYVAGVSYFNSGTKGTPLTWAQGNVSYYTDLGNLSPLLPGPSADTFVGEFAGVRSA